MIALAVKLFFSGMTALSAQFVKRTIKAGRDGIEISDDTIQSGDAVTVEKV